MNLKIKDSEILSNFVNESSNIDLINTKLKFQYHKYFVNEEKKTVTCQIKCHFYDANLGYPNWLLEDFQVIYTSTCLPEDEFNVQVGKQVARAQAEKMAYQHVVNELRQASKVVRQLEKKLTAARGKFVGYVEHQNDYLTQF